MEPRCQDSCRPGCSLGLGRPSVENWLYHPSVKDSTSLNVSLLKESPSVAVLHTYAFTDNGY